MYITITLQFLSYVDTYEGYSVIYVHALSKQSTTLIFVESRIQTICNILLQQHTYRNISSWFRSLLENAALSLKVGDSSDSSSTYTGIESVLLMEFVLWIGGGIEGTE